jgi:hypothetical protein
MRTLKLIILVAGLALSSCAKEDPKPERYRQPDEVKVPREVKEIKNGG